MKKEVYTMINKQVTIYITIIIILIIIILFAFSFFHLRKSKDIENNDQEEIKYKFGINIIPITPIAGENISGIYNITWEVKSYHSNYHTIFVGGNYTEIYYSIDNGSNWILIINIQTGRIGSYFYLWNTSDLINNSYFLQLKISVVSNTFYDYSETIIRNLKVSKKN